MFTEPELQNGDLMYLESLQVDFGQANSQLTELAQSSGFEDSVPSVGSLFNMDFPHYDHFSSPISDQLIQDHPQPIPWSSAAPSVIPQPLAPMTPPSTESKGTCVPDMYDALKSLECLDPIFPQSLPTLRNAVRLAQTTLECEICNHKNFQHMMVTGTLLQVTAERYARVLHSIDQQSHSDEEARRKRTLRMGEVSTDPSLAMQHTGQPGCPMGFEIEIEPSEWRRLARRVVQIDIFALGDEDEQEKVEEGKASRCGLMGVLKKMRRRQQERHAAFFATNPQAKHLSGLANCSSLNQETPMCLRVIQNVTDVVNHLVKDDSASRKEQPVF